MGQLSKILRDTNDNGLIFMCPGCSCPHRIQHGQGKGPRWNWNGNAEEPTFSPSILVTYPANPEAKEELKEWRTERRCHSYVIDGYIQFLGDCTHELAGQTVPIPQWS